MIPASLVQEARVIARRLLCFLLPALIGCSGATAAPPGGGPDGGTPDGGAPDGGGPDAGPGPQGAQISMSFARARSFYDAPFPSDDLRKADGTVDVSKV